MSTVNVRRETWKDDELTYSGHPRAHGWRPLDVTAFLETQRDWDLERDNGWIGIEILYEFHKLDVQMPKYPVEWMYDEGRVVLDLNNNPVRDFRDIPLTLSSEVEGGLLTLIRRLDDRIAWPDLWARLSVHPSQSSDQQSLTSDSPEKGQKGSILSVPTLTERSRQWSLKNCVPAWKKRLGSEKITDYFWSRMSPAARDANSTRELSKLSREEMAEVESMNDNDPKHKRKARGARGHNKHLQGARTREPVQVQIVEGCDKLLGGAPKIRPALPPRRHQYGQPRPGFALQFPGNVMKPQAKERQVSGGPTRGAAYTPRGPSSANLLSQKPLPILRPFSSANYIFTQSCPLKWQDQNMLTESNFAARHEDLSPFDPWEGPSSGTNGHAPDPLTSDSSLASMASLNEVNGGVGSTGGRLDDPLSDVMWCQEPWKSGLEGATGEDDAFTDNLWMSEQGVVHSDNGMIDGGRDVS